MSCSRWINTNKWELIKTAATLAFCVFILLLMGCATPEPYARVGIHHLINPTQAPNPAFIGELGVRWHDGTTCQWTHLSMITEGAPFNSRPDLSIDALGCSYTFGGTRSEWR